MELKNSFACILVYFLVVLFTAGVCFSAETETTNNIEDFQDSSDLDDFENSDDFDDFESSSESDTAIPESASINEPEKPSIYNLKGDFTFSITDNIAHEKPATGQTDWRDISSVKSELFLELDVKLPASWGLKVSGSGFYDSIYSMNDRSDYSDEVLKEDESGAELRKAYIFGNITDSLDIKAGRQIVVWGKSDNIRVTDVINPVNLKAPGMTDLEDIRLPVSMTKIDYYIGPWNLSGMAIHEKRFNKLPEFGNDFYFNINNISENEPSENLDNTEYAVSLNGTFSGWDASLYYADFYDKTPYFNIVFLPFGEFELLYSHQTMAGADVNIALGNFLLKSEAAYFSSVDFSDYMSLPLLIVETKKSYSKIKSLGGIEFTGFNDTTLSLEIMNTHIRDIDSLAKAANINKNTWETSIRINRTFFNEKLSTTLLAMLYGKNLDEGVLFRTSCDYDLTDNFTITAGAVFYDGNKMVLLKNYKDNDRIYTNFEYSF